MSVVVVMPAYDEEDCIEGVVGAWLEVMSSVGGRLLVIDDGSTDRTGALLDGLADRDARIRVVHQPNAGHGPTVLRGYREALRESPRYVFQTDSDDQFPAEEFWKLWRERERAAFVHGVRRDRSDAAGRRLISRVLARLIVWLFGYRIQDANVPFRLMSADALEGLLPSIPGDVFAPNIFLSIAAHEAGYGLLELPIEHRARRTGEVHIVRAGLAKACLRSGIELWHFRRSVRNPEFRIRGDASAHAAKR